MLNKAMLIGHVGNDPEIHRTNDGRPIATFSLATSERWRDKNTGDRREATEWHRVVCFNENLCKLIEQYVKKGSRLHVEGAIKTRKWEKDGVDRYSTEIVLQNFGGAITLLDRADNSGRHDYSAYDRGTASLSSSAEREQRAPPSAARPHDNGFDDDIPF